MTTQIGLSALIVWTLDLRFILVRGGYLGFSFLFLLRLFVTESLPFWLTFNCFGLSDVFNMSFPSFYWTLANKTDLAICICNFIEVFIKKRGKKKKLMRYLVLNPRSSTDLELKHLFCNIERLDWNSTEYSSQIQPFHLKLDFFLTSEICCLVSIIYYRTHERQPMHLGKCLWTRPRDIWKMFLHTNKPFLSHAFVVGLVVLLR